MKAYIGNVDWADEGDVFFFSVESEENLKDQKSWEDIQKWFDNKREYGN